MPDSPFADDGPHPEPQHAFGTISPASLSGDEVYLIPPTEPERKARSAVRTVLGVSLAAVLVAAAGVGVYAYESLASSGTQPEKAIPGTAIAFAKIDLDPAAGQKIAVYRLGQKIGSLKGEFTNPKNIQDSLASSALLGQGSGWDYNTDVKPWLGSRIAVAAVPDPDSSAGLDPVLAIAFTNRTKMVAALQKAASQGESFGYTTRDNYVLISDTQAHADQILAQSQKSSLSSNQNYSGDIRALGGDQLADAWVDSGAFYRAVKAAASVHGLSSPGTSAAMAALPEMKGRFVSGLHADADYLELIGMTRGVAGTPPVKGKNGILTLPADTNAAVELAGLGQTLTHAWNVLPASMRSTYQQLLPGNSVRLPTDLLAMFGTDLTIAERGTEARPQVAMRVITSQGARGTSILKGLLADAGLNNLPAVAVTQTAEGYSAGNDPGYLAQVASGKGQLGSSSIFKKAVPGAAGASAVVFVNIGALVDEDTTLNAKQRKNWAHLSALGLSTTTTSAGSKLIIRLTSR